MNILFYCDGDAGTLQSSFRRALEVPAFAHALIDGHKDSLSVDPSTITAAIVWLPPDDFFDKLENLTHVFALAAGVDQLLEHPGLPTSVSVVRLQDAGMAEQIAEYVLYGVIRAQRNFHEYDVAQKQNQWLHGLPVKRKTDIHIGMLGAGTLGSVAAKTLADNGYQVTCWSRTPKTLAKSVHSVSGAHALPAFLGRCDVLVCLLPLTPDTHGILDTSLFKQLPRNAFVINCARGAHLVDVDLLNAIDEGHLSGAMLDVFHHEPLAQNHPFWGHPRILVTPHEAARSLADESLEQILHSIRQLDLGQTPNAAVNRSQGY